MGYTDHEINDRLKALPGWSFNGKDIQRELLFHDFKAALDAMNRIGEVAEELDHHPDWTNVYNRLIIRLWTHSENGITSRDFDLAARINSLFPPSD